ncbi:MULTISPECIES: NADPH-dependent F420 reductase [unclassified Corallococcus]|uniref:NADPH-dependent F420 reductase n=1 Tax=unclassified Corallococcus TaxID=2685029 RepID=UPI001A8C8AE8|nr:MULTISPECIES: NAD(P)-binding domain-containing protein [unclassified Corallococcus]MBN9685252.1 NAD(P)-binding domain-containing protein [Corallococcus sp. NCSPR001]WAS83292.1 NAD(P)-binding domain-containing protein [Corallococcus sp. NCRR]
MKIAILGTGMVGETLGGKLVALGHEVRMGSRTPDNAKAAAWVKKAGGQASQGTFRDAAAFAELLFNCTLGNASLDVLKSAGEEALRGKVLVDVSNPLDFTKGMPPGLSTPPDDSLGEQLQRAFPSLKVVKTLNTMNCEVMVDPSRVPGDHDVFVSGNDVDAKARVKQLLTEGFGWKHVIDLGDITTARGTEAFLPLWLRLWGTLRTGNFNIHVVKR